MIEKGIPTKIANIALKAMLYEVNANPKPGLVDSLNTGSHEDMDVFTFIDSSISLYPYMLECSELGYSFNEKNSNNLFQSLREIGMRAEKDMLYETKGINTQKGLIFIFGIICANAGRILNKSKQIDIEEICNISSIMVKGIVNEELASLDKARDANLTAGERMYLDYGITGIRGEVEKGFPTVMKYGLPNLSKGLEKGLSLNQAFIDTLLYIMSYAEDTNVLWRGGIKSLEIMRKLAREAISLGGIGTVEGRVCIDNMNKEFINRNISPGGSADLLATTIMFYLMDREFNAKGDIYG